MRNKTCLLVLSCLLWATPAFAQVPSDFHAWFLAQVAGKPFGQQTLLEIAPLLPCVGSKITPPNADGERTKIWDPNSQTWTRVGFGEGFWVWIHQGDGAPPTITAQDLQPCSQGSPTSPTSPPTESGSTAVLLQATLSRLDSIIAQNERIYLDLVKRMEALERNDFTQIKDVYDLLKQHDENPSWLKKVVGNHYVQLLGAGLIAKFGLPALGL